MKEEGESAYIYTYYTWREERESGPLEIFSWRRRFPWRARASQRERGARPSDEGEARSFLSTSGRRCTLYSHMHVHSPPPTPPVFHLMLFFYIYTHSRTATLNLQKHYTRIVVYPQHTVRSNRLSKNLLSWPLSRAVFIPCSHTPITYIYVRAMSLYLYLFKNFHPLARVYYVYLGETSAWNAE